MKSTEEELWKTTHCQEDYEVSNLGRVRRVLRNGGGYYYLKPQITDRGYFNIGIRRKKYRIHRLVSEVFVSGKTSNRCFVNHKNGIKTDNRANNLEWVTDDENQYHALSVLGVMPHVPTIVFDNKGNKIAEFESKSLANKFGFSIRNQLPSSEYTKDKALEQINKPRKKPEYKEPRVVGGNDFDVTCDPELKQRVLLDLKNKRSIKEIISEYGLTYYKISLLKGTPYMRDK